MPRLKLSEIRKMKVDELEGKLAELKSELAKLKNASTRGTIGKGSGKIRNVRHNVARVLTVMNEQRSRGGRTK